jgi:hypothetical protein
MPKYRIDLVAEFYRDIVVEADTLDEAKRKAEAYFNGAEIRIAPSEDNFFCH